MWINGARAVGVAHSAEPMEHIGSRWLPGRSRQRHLAATRIVAQGQAGAISPIVPSLRRGGSKAVDQNEILKAACIQAAAVSWQQTSLREGGSSDPKMIADKITQFAAMLYEAWIKNQPK
jgi:hypothetical protein